METLCDKYEDKIEGTLNCYDRIVVQGTLKGICYAEGMTAYLYTHNIRVFDYFKFVESLRDKLIERTKQIAQDAEVEIEYIQKKNFRKEDRIAEIIKKRGDHPGLVHIFSVLEPCTSYKPWYDKKLKRAYLKYDSGKCLHYYFYFIDEQLGLCYVRVPTWCPFRLQIYCNGHNVLAALLDKLDISYKLIDNVFVYISDFQKAQCLSDSLRIEIFHKLFDSFANKYCCIIRQLDIHYHWSIMQVEYATDIIFTKQCDLKPIYETIIRTAIHAVKPEHIATFLSKKLDAHYKDQMGNNFETRIIGTRIKHTMGPVSIKVYDKLALVLRIETTVNDVAFFKHYRKVEKRNGNQELKFAHMRKGIYNLRPLAKLLFNANMRYLQFVSTIDDDRTTAIRNLFIISKKVKDKGRSYKGINFFEDNDLSLLLAIQRGEFTISGFQNKNIQNLLSLSTCNWVSRSLKRLRVHGLIKKIAHTYKYYLTSLGRKVISLGLKLRELFVIPRLSLNFPSFSN